LQNTETPTVYNPGAKTQVYQDSGITCVQWNRKVQHILASVNYSGVTSVWDLKAKRAVLSFNSPNRKLRCKALAWNPEEATQLVTASEDDSAPVIEVWDLRNTYSPTKVTYYCEKC
jgi:protein transport protein SEC31